MDLKTLHALLDVNELVVITSKVMGEGIAVDHQLVDNYYDHPSFNPYPEYIRITYAPPGDTGDHVDHIIEVLSVDAENGTLNVKTVIRPFVGNEPIHSELTLQFYKKAHL